MVEVTVADEPLRPGLLRRGLALEYATPGWNVPGTPGASPDQERAAA